MILMTVHRLVETLQAAGAEQAVDIDAALMCQTFDALGLVGFGKDFHAAEDLRGRGARTCQAIKDGAARLLQQHGSLSSSALALGTAAAEPGTSGSEHMYA